MTKLAIFHDHFCGQDLCNFSEEIRYWTILKTIKSMTIFWTQIRVKLVIFHDHCNGWDPCKFSMISVMIFQMRIRVKFLIFHDLFLQIIHKIFVIGQFWKPSYPWLLQWLGSLHIFYKKFITGQFCKLPYLGLYLERE